MTPDEGTVSLGGTPLDRVPAPVRAGAITWVPQHPQPLGTTVRGSVALGHEPGPGTDAAVDAALTDLGLTALAGAHPEEVSGGERRRTALARALVGVRLGTVRFLLVDEPTAQLDAGRRRRRSPARSWRRPAPASGSWPSPTTRA